MFGFSRKGNLNGICELGLWIFSAALDVVGGANPVVVR
jgi:hypothetical protein